MPAALAGGRARGAVAGFHRVGTVATLLLLGVERAVLAAATATAPTAAPTPPPLSWLSVRARAGRGALAGLAGLAALARLVTLAGLLRGTAGGVLCGRVLLLALVRTLAPAARTGAAIGALNCGITAARSRTCGPTGTAPPRRVGTRFGGMIGFGHPSMLPATV